jgi:DNA-directed RNA polymerase subunit RPC12/RpoP
MLKFKCSRCGGTFNSFDMIRGYNKIEDSFRCTHCGQSAKLRHFTKDITMATIIRDRNKYIWIFSIASIPIQIYVLLNIIHFIFGR